MQAQDDVQHVISRCTPLQVKIQGFTTFKAAFSSGEITDLAYLLFAVPREVPLDTYRNIGIMAHIDAGKVC